MAFRLFTRTSLACTIAAGIVAATTVATTARERATNAPLTIDTARVSIAGTSNIHAYTATTTAVRVTRVQLAPGVAGANLWEAILQPGAVEAFEIAIPAATLSSPREGLDKNMHKALNVKEHADITFRLLRLEPGGAPGAFRATGALRIAGGEREIAMAITTNRGESTLTIKGEVQLLMTDYGIAPPKAMLGMLKTDPRVTVSFEAVLSVPLT
jgi:hypothetical protein